MPRAPRDRPLPSAVERAALDLQRAIAAFERAHANTAKSWQAWVDDTDTARKAHELVVVAEKRLKDAQLAVS